MSGAATENALQLGPLERQADLIHEPLGGYVDRLPTFDDRRDDFWRQAPQGQMRANIGWRWSGPFCNLGQITYSTGSQVVDPSMGAGHGSDQGHIPNLRFIVVPANLPLLDASPKHPTSL